ncbi:MAG: hypothetical protein HC796_03350 [Synechococcaceae cyanobacterium RL_1_2]|nr:hypothetical protein [Synechococcaceae cyanobacterium RL_1_2]
MKPLLNQMLSFGRINYVIFDQQGIIHQLSALMGDLYPELEPGKNVWSLYPQLYNHQDEILGLNQHQEPVKITVQSLGLSNVWAIHQWEEQGQYIGLIEPTLEEITLVKGQQVLAETISLTGNHFFKALVKGLAKKFNFPYVFLGSLTTESDHIETLAFWDQHRLVEPQIYPLDQTPCHIVHGKQSVCFYPWDLRRELNSQTEQALPPDLNSYFAMPLINSHHKVLGYLCILDQQPLVGLEGLYTVINLLCHRAVVEIEQQRSAQELNLIKTTLAAQVKQRTEELNKTNEYLQPRITPSCCD